MVKNLSQKPVDFHLKFLPIFEEEAIDVKFSIELILKHAEYEFKAERGPFPIEIKPSISDDYPAVLRQMRSNKSTILFLNSYTGVGATRDQFIQTFNLSGITVIFKDEII